MSTVNQALPIREAHRDLTQGRILDAAIELLRHADLESLTMSTVAAQAGVTERTVYRHFATRDELLAAVWPALQERVKSRGFPLTAKALVAQPLSIFKNFDTEEGAVRASAFSNAGRELRLSVNKRRSAAIRACVLDAKPKLKEPELTRLCAVVQLLNSAYAWAVMKDFWDLDAAESGRAASEAIAALLDVKIRLPADLNSISNEEYTK
jgi:AcrR family transcriptional regulator